MLIPRLPSTIKSKASRWITRRFLHKFGVEFVIQQMSRQSLINRPGRTNFYSILMQKEIHAQGRGTEDRLHAVAKAYACRGAIKAGEELTQEEMNRLVDDLFACETPHLCPHGRPVFVRFALEELHRRFGRI